MVSLDDIDDVCVIRLSTVRLDSSVGTVIRNSIVSKFDTHTKFALDMSSVKLVDSGGLGALVAVLKNITSQQASLVLVGMQKSVKLMFELSRMDRQFKMAESVDQAVELMK